MVGFRGQTEDKICQCEKSRSSLFILSKRNEDLMVMQNVRFRVSTKLTLLFFLSLGIALALRRAKFVSCNIGL